LQSWWKLFELTTANPLFFNILQIFLQIPGEGKTGLFKEITKLFSCRDGAFDGLHSEVRLCNNVSN